MNFDHFATIGFIGGFASVIFGGWSSALSTLCIFMLLDWTTGMIVAGVFKNSPKSSTGALDSRAGGNGLLRKGMILVIVYVAARLDLILQTTFVRDGVVLAFIVNETISIIENAGLMGVPIPKAITSAVDVLRRRSEEDADFDEE